MTPDERQIESILLKERWTLIQKDTERRAIKIRGNKIFLNNKLHGEVKDSKLFLQISQDQQMDQTSNNWLNTEVQSRNQTDNILKFLIINCQSVRSQNKRNDLAAILFTL